MSKLNNHNLTHNEGGYGYNPYAEAAAAEASQKAEARIQHIIANIDSFKSAWARAVAKHSVNGKTSASAMKKIEAEAGVTLIEIQEVKRRMA